MPIILLASQCPEPVVAATIINPAAGVPLTSRAYVTGDSTFLLAKLNENACREDLVGRWGGGGYAVAQGLAISAGAGLTLNIAAGQAVIDGIVTLPSPTTLALTNGIARAYIWLSAAGAVVPVNNSLTPPAGAQCFLGSAVTSGGVITSVDQSGILYLRGGTLWRQTADTTTPTDTPPSTLIFFNRGAGSAIWFWDGTAYTDLSGAGTLAQAVILLPTTSARNVIQPSGPTIIPLTIRGFAAQSADLERWQDSSAATLARIDSGGALGLGIAPDASALFHVASTTRGTIPAPIMTTTQRNAITLPLTGLEIFNSTTNRPEFNAGTPGAPVWIGMGISFRSVISVSTNHTAGVSEDVILADATSGLLTITLPTAVGITGRLYTIKKIDASANRVRIAPNGAETVDGANPADIARQYVSLDIVSDGANWNII